MKHAQVKAVCAPTPIKLQVTDHTACEADILPAALLNLDSFGNRVASFLDAASPPNTYRTSTVYTLQPRPSPYTHTYVFAGGQNETIELTATTPTSPASVDSCLTTVTVPLTKPTAVCKPTLTLPATSGCAAHPTAVQLQAGVDAGSSQGSGGPLTVTLNPPAPSGGPYTLPVGTYPVTLTVANCAGTSSCRTLLTVADQEALDVRALLCGTHFRFVVRQWKRRAWALHFRYVTLRDMLVVIHGTMHAATSGFPLCTRGCM